MCIDYSHEAINPPSFSLPRRLLRLWSLHSLLTDIVTCHNAVDTLLSRTLAAARKIYFKRQHNFANSLQNPAKSPGIVVLTCAPTEGVSEAPLARCCAFEIL